MSNAVENRIVNMVFNNGSFEDGIKTTLNSISKLKDALSFKGVQDGLNGVSGAINNFDMSGIGTALDTITSKFSAFGILGIEVLERIANKAIDAGERLVKGLSVDQISAGWQKYADKTTAVQTILSATGDSIDTIDAQLQKLNWFTDETSYNFVDMVGNIGKFTANGIELGTAVTAMQGISNWAALSGQNAASASRAMYNLSQAIGVGSVKLMDWRSIENANMATKEFKEYVLETAAGLGKLSKQADGTYKTLSGTAVGFENFSQTLSEGWFTKEVLTDTLDLYGGFTNKLYDLSEATDITATELLGFIDDQKSGIDITGDLAKKLRISTEEAKQYADAIAEIGLDEFGLKAFKAAQEARTFRDALDATKDAVSTGWMNTFELIFGNYEKAKKLWSQLAEDLYTIFAEGGENRNAVLKEWGFSKWEALTKRINNAGYATEDFEEKLTGYLLTHGVATDSLIKEYGSLSDAIEEGAVNTKTLSDGIKSVINDFITANPVAGAAKDAQKTVEEVQSVVDGIWRGEYGNGSDRRAALEALGLEYEYYQGLAEKGSNYRVTLDDINDEMLENVGLTEDQIKALRAIQGDYSALSDLSGRSGRFYFIEGLTTSMEKIIQLITLFKSSWKEVFGEITSGALTNFAKGFKDLADSVSFWDDENEKATGIGEKLHGILISIFETLKSFGGVLKSVWNVVKPIFSALKPVASALGDVATEVFNLFTTINTKGSEAFGKIDAADIFVTICNKLADALKKVAGFVSDIRGHVEGWNLSGILSTAVDGVERIGGFLWTIADTVISVFGKLDFSNGISGFISSLETSIKSIFKVADEEGEESGKKSTFFNSLLTGIENAFNGVWAFIKDKWNKLWEYLNNEFDLKNFSLLDGAKWALIIQMFRNAFTKIDPLTGIASFFKDAGKALRDMASSSKEFKGKSLKEIIFGEKSEGISDKISKFGTALGKLISPIKTLAISVGGLALSLLLLSAIPQESLNKALLAMGVAAMEVVIALSLLSKYAGSGKKLLAVSGAILITASAFLVLAAALGAFSLVAALDPEGKGLLTMAIAIGEVALALGLLSKYCKPSELMSTSVALLGASAAMLIMAGAIALVTVSLGALMIIASVFDGWWKGLVSMVVIITAVSVALGLLAKKCEPGELLAASAAILIFSAAMVVLAAALAAFTVITSGTGWIVGLVALIAMIGILAGSALLFSKLAAHLIVAGKVLLTFAAGLAAASAAALLASIAIAALAVAVAAAGLAIATVILSVLSAIGGGVLALVGGIMGAIDIIYASIFVFVEMIIVEIASIIALITGAIDAIIQLFVAAGKGIAEIITSLLASFGEGIGRGLTAIGDGISSIGESFTTIGTGVEDLGEALKTLKDIPFLTISAGFVEIGTGMKSINKNELTANPEDILAYTDAVNALATAGSQFEASAQTLCNSLTTIGNTAGGNFVKGLETGSANAQTAGSKMSSNAYNGANSQTSSFYGIGYNMAVGLGNGVNSGSSYVYSACYNMVVNALNAARNAAVVRSPSRKFMEIGNYFSEGLAIGIIDGSANVDTASERVVNNAIKVAESAAKSVSSAVENGLTGPVITPVIDLDSVREGAQQLSGILGEHETISIGASINSQLAANQNRNSEVQSITATLDANSISALAGVNSNSKVQVDVNFEGSLSALASVLYPYIVAEEHRIGPSYIKGVA